MNPLHAPDDAAKVAALSESMAADGWVGAPLVAWDENLLTGAHRYAAAQSLDWPDGDIPTIQISEIFAAHSLDFTALCEEEGIDGIESAGLPWLINHYLPAATRDAYGLDLH